MRIIIIIIISVSHASSSVGGGVRCAVVRGMQPPQPAILILHFVGLLIDRFF